MSNTEQYVCKICFRIFKSKNNREDHFWCIKPRDREKIFSQRVQGFNRKKMKKTERDGFLEELLAATSPQYLRSIREARADYKNGRVHSHDEVFA